MYKIHIANGNTKLGQIPNVSLPPVITCRKDVPCAADGCYALKFYRMRTSCRTAWDENLEYYQNDPDGFFAEIEMAVKTSRFFRWFVSGDIPTADFFSRMVALAWRNPHCEFLCFTKQYEIVNGYCDAVAYDKIPANLHILFSTWEGFTPENPYKFPETAVYKKGDEVPSDWLLCGGNCTNCACRGVGCWEAKAGQTIAFQKH